MQTGVRNGLGAVVCAPGKCRQVRRGQYPDCCCSALVFPEENAAEDPLSVGDDGHVGGKFEVELLGVSAADVEVVPIEELFRLLDALQDERVPAILAEFVEAAAAEVI